MNLSENYRTYGYLPVDVTRGGDDREDFDLYDTHVRQAVPVVFTVRAPNRAVEHKVVCLSPNTVVEGSRVPESAAALTNPRASFGAALAVMVLMSIMSIA